MAVRIALLSFIAGLGCFLIQPVFGDHILFPINKEISFLWHAKITVGSSFPVEKSSIWGLNATLTVQTSAEGSVFEIRDVKSDGYFGDQSQLRLSFRAVFKDGVLESLSAHPSESEWSLNIKRALVNLLQIDVNPIKAGSQAFLSEEVGLYGKCKVEYIVAPGGTKNNKKVKKVLDLQSCSNSPAVHWSSSPKFLCPSSYQPDVVAHSERDYVINLDSPMIIKNVTGRGSITLQPYQAQAEAHYSLVSQTLVAKAVTQIKKTISFSEAATPVDLWYKEIQLDATHGLPPSNKTIVLKETAALLEELSDSLWWEVGSRGLNNETVFGLLNLMGWLDLADWETLYHSVTLGTSYQQETVQHMFWELVPRVGSTASALFIRDLIKSERVKGILAGRLLVNFPFYQRKPTEELLTQCEEFLHLSSKITKDVRSSAVLSFATLIHKTCAFGCKDDTIDRYAKLYLDRFTDSEEYEERMLYLQGLGSIELSQSLDYLAPIITGQSSSRPDRHTQFLASWAIINSVYTNPTKVFELFWPLLMDRSQTLEMRVAAMTMVIMSKPSSDRFISLFWYMQTETSLQLYNYYYTTIKSLASTTYPCYSNLGSIASQISRFVMKKSTTWGTGNYLLDYEDKERGYGGMLQLLSIASERTGLPNVFIFIAEQHSLGVTTSYALYLKAEGVADGVKRQLYNMTAEKRINFQKIAKLLSSLKAPLKSEEDIHLEFILKVDGRTVETQFLNSSSFENISTVVRRLSSIYFEFSVNFQRLMFPLILTKSQPTDLGIPSLVQVRSGTLLSARGSVSQDDEGRARNAELDLRHSWNGITSLQVYSPMSNQWYGATRSRSLHIRLPFAVQLHLNLAKNSFKMKTIHHRDYMAGSRLGVVWHAVTHLKSQAPTLNISHPIKEEWTMDSQDLGARLGASVFNCQGKSTISDALHLLKKAFLTKEKNYQMVPGGVVLLGLFSLKEQVAFQPQGSNCGVMLSFTPLLSQVEPVISLEKDQLKLQMSMKDGVLWEIQAGLKKRLDGNKELAFKLYHTPSVRTQATDIWRVIQFEGAFVLPSKKAGVFNPPYPLSGYTFVSWGDSSPTLSDKAAVVDVKVEPDNGYQDRQCPDLAPACLQTLSERATQQVATVQYLNLPDWLLTAAHALFPEHIQTESSSTRIHFSSPASMPPWSSKGLCAINNQSVLTIDNSTLDLSLPSCYTLLVADCSQDTSFAVLLKKVAGSNQLAMKLYTGSDVVELLPTANGNIDVIINENIKLNSITTDYEHGGTPDSSPLFSIAVRSGGVVEVELREGLVVQHHSRTVVALVPSAARGYTCGLCGDYNSDTNSEPVAQYTQC